MLAGESESPMFRDDLLGVERITVPLKTAFATADTEDEFPAFRAPYAATVTALRYIPETAITGDATNHAVLSAQNKGAAGSGTDEVASFAFDTPTTDDVAALDEKAITLSATAANLNLAAGDIVSIKKTTPGTGLALDGIVIFEIRKRGA